MLIESSDLPHTSQINSYTFEQEYEKIQESGDSAIVILMSSRLSGTYQNAVLAARDYDNIHVVDSKNGSIGEQLLVRYAVMLRDKKRDPDDIVRRLEVRRNQIRVLALLDTLEYVKRGGRLGAAAAAFGTLLSIKPVLTVENGKLKVLGKARGSRNGNNFLNKEIMETGIEPRLPAAVAYSGLDHSKLDHYIEDSRHIWEGLIDHLPMSQLGSTIGTHAGPGTIVVAYFMKQPKV
jgi:DegV family protein with EDD domain